MPQMTNAQARVVDRALTEVAQGYQQPGLVGSALFPRVNVNQRGAKIISFDRSHMKLYSGTQRAPGSQVPEVAVGYASSSIDLQDFALAGKLPYETQQEAENGPGIDMSFTTVEAVVQALQIRLENMQATLATTAASYAAANKVTLSGTAQWSDYSGISNPIISIETAKEAVRTATGYRANTVVMGAAVYSKVRAHPSIVARLVPTGRDIADEESLAKLFGVDRVLVGSSILSNDGETAFTDVWGKFVVAAYTDTASVPDRGRPSYGYTYNLNGYPYARPPWNKEDVLSWMFPVLAAERPVITNVNAGYLISAAVA